MTLQISDGDRFVFRSEFEELHCFMKLKGSVRDEAWPVQYFGVIHGQQPDGSTRPLMGFESLEHTRFVPHENGSFSMIEAMVTYYTDLKTGEYISTFDNPYTGKTNRVVSNYASGESYSIRTTSIVPLFGNGYTDPGIGMGLRWFQSKGRIWVQYDRTYPDDWPTPSSEMITYEASAEEVFRPNVVGVEAAFSSTAILPWFKWLKMGDRPGWVLWHANGLKLRSLSQLPQRLRDQLAKHHPQALVTPSRKTRRVP